MALDNKYSCTLTRICQKIVQSNEAKTLFFGSNYLNFFWEPLVFLANFRFIANIT